MGHNLLEVVMVRLML